MNLQIEFKDYLLAMKGQSNRPLNLSIVLAPFGVLGAPSIEDSFLLTGHVLDGLAEEFLVTEMIDPSDVLRVAHELGAEATSSI